MVVATNNKGKLEEIKNIFSDYDIYSLNDKGIKCDIDQEKAISFLENLFILKQEKPYLYTFFVSSLYPIFYLVNFYLLISDCCYEFQLNFF